MDEVQRLKQENAELRKEILQLKNRAEENQAYWPGLDKGDDGVSFEQLESFLNPILDLVPHHIVFIDGNGLITLCNLQAARDLHADRRVIVGRHIRELLRIPDDQINLLESLRTKKPIVNREVLDKNYGINNTRIILDENGNVKRVLGAFQFLNGVKEAEKQALAGRIAAGIAHEIRNPLTTVRGYLQLLQSKTDQEVSELFSSLLIPEIDRANKIITDFLRIAKPGETTSELLNAKEFILGYTGKFLNSEALLYNAEIEYQLTEITDNTFFRGDRDELLQVFINLFRNAFQAKGSEPLKIIIAAKRVDSFLRIEFRDNGRGIPSSILPHIFDPFFTTKDEGTGLGLSVSKKVIENHGGMMNVKSDGQGTQFIIDIPAEDRFCCE
ncbi:MULTISPECIES: nitrogen regulation protein NR(II) [Bacillus]|uniref:two-component system sensor histidine kinase NtrB n=1 Tax=Bacillus TaxID=1386 RepID=UPI000C776ED4|nr:MULTISPECIES: ATP-binding protein [Bacillus]MCA1036926.1 PAS domain-containing sensor histidine kinase [Bacillus infantis]MCP1159135.1 ATP-binding protein [Bacillus infantis]PLR72047.1 PAS domain-containing sensor histidine kinase [Bacillus sp. UMB0728]RYI31065.1 PAS domain-containing sensor histidine kinase [Bacillus infantis]